MSAERQPRDRARSDALATCAKKEITAISRFIPAVSYSRGLAIEASFDLMQKLRRTERLLHPAGRPAEPDDRWAAYWRSPAVPEGLHA